MAVDGKTAASQEVSHSAKASNSSFTFLECTKIAVSSPTVTPYRTITHFSRHIVHEIWMREPNASMRKTFAKTEVKYHRFQT